MLFARCRELRVAVVGDFCLDRYLDIDPTRQELSLETGLPVYNVTRVRAEPGGAGTVFNNLIALGVKEAFPVGFCGVDGEGFELRRGLGAHAVARLDYFIETPRRRTFTYCKPLLVYPDKPPQELNRLDSKNWTATPPDLQEKLAQAVLEIGETADAMVLLEQVEEPDTGVICRPVLRAVEELRERRKNLVIMADSRRGLRGYPPVIFKMNRREFCALTGMAEARSVSEIMQMAGAFAGEVGNRVFITLAEEGLVGADPRLGVEHVPALPLRGPVDIVGAGDAVTANLVCALAAGAQLREALEIAAAAASVVIHKLGVTGTASAAEILPLLCTD